MRTAIVLGTFDGVHIGHRAVIETAINSGFKGVAVAFPESPRGIITNQKSIITPFSEKREILLSLGIKEVHYLDFAQVKETAPLDFLAFLEREFNPKMIVCGFNYRFGKNGLGDTSVIREFCAVRGIEFVEVAPVSVGDKIVSSTLIRDMLSKGDIEGANALLGRPFGFSAEVIHGDKRGRTIGFPTINQVYPQNAARIKFGVYATTVTIGGREYRGITNVGIRPTFESETVLAETHVVDFSGEIYGSTVNLRFNKFIRDERKFSGVAELKENIENDLKNC